MDDEGNAAILVTGDKQITSHPCILRRIVPFASTDGGDVTVYDGRSTAGRSLGTFKGLASQHLSVELGIRCNEGVHVEIGTNMAACLVVFKLLPEP